ncbi:MAG: hypothetical protein L7T25_02845, partial [Gammaproteobacteria bacterium]|nr:hypothetical protein [Gammaproteobacteria bacterium]
LIIIKESIKKDSAISDLVSDLDLLRVINENIDTDNLENINDDFLTHLTNNINNENPEGRVVIRASGTEPLIRISIENNDQVASEKILESIVDAIKENG